MRVFASALDVRPRTRRAVGFALLTVTAVLLGRATYLNDLGVALTWPAAGIVVLWCYDARGRRERVASIVGVVVTVSLGNLVTGASGRATVLYVLINLGNALAGAEVLRRLRGSAPFQLRSVSDVSVAGVAAAGGAIAAAGVTLLGGVLVPELATWAGTFLVFARNATSTFVVLVFVGGFLAGGLHHRERTREGLAMLLVTALACVGLFRFDGTPPLTFTVFAITAWAGLRLGVRWTTLHGAVAAVAATGLTLAGYGVFGQLHPAPGAVLLAQAFLVVLVGVGLSIALLHGAVLEATELERASSRRLAATVEAALVGHGIVSLERGEEGRFLAVNPALGELLDFRADELRGRCWPEVVAEEDRSRVEDTLAALRRGSVRTWTGELCHTTATGGSRWAQVAVARVDDDGPARASVQLLDITERKALEADLTHLALHDALTGLPNRVLLLDRLEVALGEDVRDGTRTAVIFLDLDDFKHVNDSLGHRAGDRLLVAVAERLRAVVRPGDTVSRMAVTSSSSAARTSTPPRRRPRWPIASWLRSRNPSR